MRVGPSWWKEIDIFLSLSVSTILSMWGYSKKVTVCEPVEGLHREPDHVAPRTKRNVTVRNVCYFRHPAMVSCYSSLSRLRHQQRSHWRDHPVGRFRKNYSNSSYFSSDLDSCQSALTLKQRKHFPQDNERSNAQMIAILLGFLFPFLLSLSWFLVHDSDSRLQSSLLESPVLWLQMPPNSEYSQTCSSSSDLLPELLSAIQHRVNTLAPLNPGSMINIVTQLPKGCTIRTESTS